MPELTVAMPAYNTGEFIAIAIRSVLAQEESDFELVVVDDGSIDNTVDAVNSFSDSRVTLLRNSVNRGVAYCHNVIIRHSQAPFIAHVDSDDIVLPGAFSKLVARLKNSPNVGQVHCHYFNIDEEGEFIDLARPWLLKRTFTHGSRATDYKRDLVFWGAVNNGLRTYRREVFDVVGPFNETMKNGIDHEMALRIIDRFDMELVPEFLYARRIHHASVSYFRGPRRLKWYRNWIRRYARCHRLLRNNRVQFLKQKEYNLHKLMFMRLSRHLKIHRFMR